MKIFEEILRGMIGNLNSGKNFFEGGRFNVSDLHRLYHRPFSLSYCFLSLIVLCFGQAMFGPANSLYVLASSVGPNLHGPHIQQPD